MKMPRVDPERGEGEPWENDTEQSLVPLGRPNRTGLRRALLQSRAVVPAPHIQQYRK